MTTSPCGPGTPTVGILPTCVDLAVYRGDDAGFIFQVLDTDLTGAQAACQLRRGPDDVVPAASLDLTVDPATSTITVLIPAETSALLRGGYRYDLQVTLGGAVTTVATGAFTVALDVTRPQTAADTAVSSPTPTPNLTANQQAAAHRPRGRALAAAGAGASSGSG